MNAHGLDRGRTPAHKWAEALVRDVLRAHARDVDAKGRFPSESIEALAVNGFLGLFVPVEAGGGGGDLRLFASLVEQFAQECGSTAMVFIMHVAAGQAIAASKTFASRTEVLADIARGSHLTTLAFSERGSRSQFWAVAALAGLIGAATLTVVAQSKPQPAPTQKPPSPPGGICVVSTLQRSWPSRASTAWMTPP